MKKIILIFGILLLLVGSVNAFNSVPIEEHPYFRELSPFEQLFSIATLPSQVKQGGKIQIGFDEEANKDCSQSYLLLQIFDPDGKIIDFANKYQDDIKINQRIQTTISYIIRADAKVGTWTLKSDLLCLSSGQKSISKSGGTSKNFEVILTGEPCVEKIIGSPYCDNTGNLVLEDRVTCLGGVPIIKPYIKEQCKSDEVCDNRKCETKQELDIICGDGKCELGETRENCAKDCGDPEIIQPNPPVIPDGKVCCEIGPTALLSHQILHEPFCTGINRKIVEPSKCAAEGGSGVPTGEEEDERKRGIFEDELEDKTEEEIESQSCKTDADCKPPAECVPFRNLPKEVRKEIGGSYLGLEPDENVCIISAPEKDISEVLSKEAFKLGGYSISWIIVGIFLVVVLIFVKGIGGSK